MLLVAALLTIPTLWAQEFVYNDSPNPPGLHKASSDNQKILLTFSIDRFSLEAIDIKGEAMKNIVLSGAFLPADEGMPNVPSISRYIAIPNGSKPTVKVTAGATETVYDVDIAPAPRLPLDNDVIVDPPSVLEIPTLDEVGLAALALLLIAAALVALRRQGTSR